MPDVILVADGVFAKGEAIFRTVADFKVESAASPEQRLAEAVMARRSRAVIVGVDRYSGPLYEALAATAGGRGAIISRFGVGHDGIDKPLARRRGIVVTNTPNTLDDSVAEHTLWLIGNLARQISRSETRFRAGEFASGVGLELRGKVLGVLGFGGIGRRVAAAAHFGFGMHVLAAGSRSAAQLASDERRPLADVLSAHGVAEYTHMIEPILGQADVVSLHLPATPQTRRLLDAGWLRQMKAGAFLINTARGAVLDEAALFDALVERRLGGAALDVFEQEPYRPVAPDKDLRTLENVVLTPHIGSNTREANQRMAVASLQNVRHFLAGRPERLTRVDQIVPGSPSCP